MIVYSTDDIFTVCTRRQLRPGLLWLWKSSNWWVLCFPTKDDWWEDSQIGWIDEGLAKFAATYRERGIMSAAFPKLGCGHGGLDWGDVRPLMEKHLGGLPIPITIHVGQGEKI